MRYDLVINEFVRGARTEGAITVFGGGQMRPFLEINSAVRAFSQGIKSNYRGEIFNIVDVNVNLRELGKIVGNIFGCTVKTIPEIVDRRSYSVDNFKAMKSLNFKPQDLAEGIGKMKVLSV